eukprot:4146691-Amphidinium_carterae.1
MLMSGDNLSVSSGCLDQDDFNGAEDYKKNAHTSAARKGCSLQNVLKKGELNKGLRTGRHPDAVPGSRSRFYGGPSGMTSEEASQHVYMWLWKLLQDKTGQVCPHAV